MLQIFFRGSKCPVADLNYPLCFYTDWNIEEIENISD